MRFQQSVEALAASGADTFVEAGFGGVLANLVKRIDKAATRACVQDLSLIHISPPKPAAAKPQTFEKDKDDPFANVGRNDPCPCGSGKKFKKCHGANQ